MFYIMTSFVHITHDDKFVSTFVFINIFYEMTRKVAQYKFL